MALKGRKQKVLFLHRLFSWLYKLCFTSGLFCSLCTSWKASLLYFKTCFRKLFLPLYPEPLFSYLAFPISHSHSSILVLLWDPSFYLTAFFLIPKEGQTSDFCNLTKVCICIWIHTALSLLNSLQRACSQSTYAFSACVTTLLPFTSSRLLSSVPTTKLCN